MHALKSKYSSLKILLMLYAAFYTLSVILLKTSQVRPASYYVVIAVLAMIVLIEILSGDVSEKKAVIILLQIMLLSLNLIWGVTLKYYYYTGFTDVFGHVGLAVSLLQTGYVTDVFDVYKPFPLWHILANAFYTFSGLPLRMDKVLNILCGIVFFLMPAAIYLLSRQLIGKRTALLAALIVFFYPTLIAYGMYSIPRSVESFLFVLLLLVLLDSGDKIRYYLALLLMFLIIVYHTASVNYIFLILVMIYALQKIQPKKDGLPLVKFEFLLISGAMTFVYWTLYANTLIDRLLTDIFSPAPTGALTKSIYVAPLTEVFNYAQYVPTILFIIVGVLLVWGHKRFDSRVKMMGLLALVLSMASFPGPLLLINKLAGNFNFGRFEEYTFIFIGLMAAVGFGYLYFRSSRLFKAGLVLFFGIWVCLSVSNDFVALDNPLVKRPFYTFYLTEEEVNGIDRLSSVTTGNVLSDYVSVRYLNSTQFVRNVSMIRFDKNDSQIFKRRSIDTILIREGELDARPLQFLTTDSRGYSNLGDYYYRGDPIYDQLNNYSRIYDSNNLEAYGGVVHRG